MAESYRYFIWHFFQLKKYYEDHEDVCPPLRLDPCIISQGDQVFLTEPLVSFVQVDHVCSNLTKWVKLGSQPTLDNTEMKI